MGVLVLLFLPALQAAWAVEVQVEGVSGQLRDNVEAWIGEPAGDSRRALRAYQRQLPERAGQALQALGYYEPEIDVEREETDNGPRFILRIDAGEPVRIALVDLRIDGEAAEDSAFDGIQARLPVQPGAVLRHDRYETARRQLQTLALDRGYFDARYTQRRVEVDVEAGEATVILHFDSGRRYSMGDVQFSETALAPWFLERLVHFEPGDPYESRHVSELNRALLNSGYFAQVSVRPEPREADETLRVPVQVELTAERPHQVRTGVGYSTDVGPRIRAGWSRPWVNRRGHTLSVDTELSEKRQNISTRYGIPLRDPLRTQLVLQGGFQYEDIEDTESELYTLSVQHQHRFESGWQQNLGIRWDRERFTISDETRTTTLYLPGGSWSRNRARGGADPHWGDRLLFSVEGTDEWMGSDIDVFRVRTGARLLRSFADNHRVLLRADLGGLTSSEFEKVPPTLRFFAGGDQSVRGYRYQTLAPEDDEGDVIGGKYLAVASAEYGYTFRPNWRLAAFTDAGNAFDDWDDPDPQVGAGFGIRWISPVGPIRLDFASALSKSGNPWRLHFSMGPEI
ncbi:autotransporter secretion outer membrane protein TamA [Alkalispirillum mobile]|uniref:Translocation and assembly module subunit TamA n=1 Tax=Alkalispirillum mobile TaxID=85925 RepID=A0A498CD75_9GAMM|nr:autotransporter secretion outer membrane protein TamA [Alkalispirillum mobile]